ncbi:hypothetical protein [Paenibacillus rhizoplanae]|uniref:Uncharacterized protein n=1 Tax=Paenibacillus rhizoplanae TaxID=1917181 RepID=A0ABW5F1B3_9BACL
MKDTEAGVMLLWQVFEYGIGGGVKEVRQGGDNRCGKKLFFSTGNG